jgi:hypothetical protein
MRLTKGPVHHSGRCQPHLGSPPNGSRSCFPMARPQVRGTSSACSVKTVAILLGAGRGGYGYLPGLTSTSTTILRPSECDARLVSAATPRPKRSRRILTPPQRRVDVLHDRQKYPAGSGECQRQAAGGQTATHRSPPKPATRPGSSTASCTAAQRGPGTVPDDLEWTIPRLGRPAFARRHTRTASAVAGRLRSRPGGSTR